jgi:hypothetical protein
MKTKKSILISIFALALMLFGVGAVKAAGTSLQADDYYVTCLQGDKGNAITSKNGTTLCYVVAAAKNTAGADAGFFSLAYSHGGLKILGTEAYSTVSKAMWIAANSGSQTPMKSDDSSAPSQLTSGVCEAATYVSGSAAKDIESTGCGAFYSPTGGDKVFTKTNMEDSSGTIITADMKTNMESGAYLVVGAFKVQITKEGNGCGKICVKTMEIEEDYMWSCAVKDKNGERKPSGDNVPEGTNCGNWPNDYCKEVHYNVTNKVTPEPENEKTGAFASYTILAAGALIAISAITIAKKHNRISKV